ncbi:MAG: fibronectin type III domain-containing protein [Treponema sp.]|jgi:hypothetical protein|nr:fibronectin type III domain-containing protein [Treponema sp.]
MKKQIMLLGALAIALMLVTMGCKDTTDTVTPDTVTPPATPANLHTTAVTTDSVSLAWDEVTGATKYALYRASAATGPWDAATLVSDTLTALTYNDTGRTPATAYYYAVKAGNTGGWSAVSAAVLGTTEAASVPPPAYAAIDMTGANKGILDDDFSDNTKAASSTDKWGPSDGTVTYAIDGLYVANDETNLYIALDFGAAVAAWENDRITLFIDNTNSTDGSKAFTNADWTNAATVVSAPEATLEGYVFHYMPTATGSGEAAAGATSTVAAWTKDGSDYAVRPDPEVSVIKYQIPLASLGASAGNVVQVFAAFSNYWWSDTAHIQVKNMIPATAGATSKTSDDNDTLAVTMASALSYTVK